MKKAAGRISWLIAVLSAMGIGISGCFTKSLPIICLSLIGLFVGIIGILIFCPETRKQIWKLLDFI